MAQVDQALIDKLPAGGPSAQWSRMYVAPMDEPRLCDLMAGAELGEDGEVYVTGVQGTMAAPVRLEFLYADLQVLKVHQNSRNLAVLENQLLEFSFFTNLKGLGYIPCSRK